MADTMECAGCTQRTDKTVSEYPPLGTPSDKILVVRGKRLASMHCTNPSCGCYTIYAPSRSIAATFIQRLKLKKILTER